MLGWAGVEEGYLPEMADASAEGIHADASAISGRLAHPGGWQRSGRGTRVGGGWCWGRVMFLPVYYVHCRQKSLAHTFSGRRMLRLPFVMFQYQPQSNPLG